MALSERKSGVLLHISSLPSKYGIGDLGPQSRKFALLLKESSQTYWQILPLTPLSSLMAYSPYASSSAFAGNTLLISPDILYEKGFLKKNEIAGEAEYFARDTYLRHVDFAAVSGRKNALLDQAYQRFLSMKGKIREEFEKFCTQQAKDWLDGYAFFKVIKAGFKGRSWSSWPDALRDGDFSSFGKDIEEGAVRERFFQYLFFSQWHALKRYCNQIGIKIIGDVPIYVDYESSDVWTNTHLFKLDGQKKPLFISGVPPDYFSLTGQLWNNPVYDWKKLKEEDYRWWIKRIEHNLSMYDMIRIDHFRGFIAYWEVGANEKNAMNGKWARAGAESFFQVLNKRHNAAGDIPIIAEDLGYITKDVIRIMKKNDFPGIRVVLFAFGDDFPHSIHLPHHYGKNCVAYTGTHDNNTIIGFFQKDASCIEKENLAEYIKKESDIRTVHEDLIRLVSASQADLCIIPVQDILGLGPQARMNHPSTTKGNWVWRMAKEDMDLKKFTFLADCTKKYTRAPNIDMIE